MNTPGTSTRRFEFVAGTSCKFWEVTVQDCNVTVRYGRIGSNGQRLVKTLPDAAVAAQHADKLIAEKNGKGYRDVA